MRLTLVRLLKGNLWDYLSNPHNWLTYTIRVGRQVQNTRCSVWIAFIAPGQEKSMKTPQNAVVYDGGKAFERFQQGLSQAIRVSKTELQDRMAEYDVARAQRPLRGRKPLGVTEGSSRRA